MKIRFDAARSEPYHWQESIEIAPSELDEPGLSALSPVECRGSLTSSESGFHFRGGLHFGLTVACDRCLKEFETEVDGELDLMIVERGRPRGSAEIELTESDLGVVEVSGDGIDTRPLVLEQVALGVPTKPLCREDCRGLCPECGIDRNVESCACDVEKIDSRWSALAALRGSLPGGNSSAN